MNISIDRGTNMMLVFLISTIISAFLFGIIGNLLSWYFLDINTFISNFDIELLSQQQQLSLFRLTQPLNTIGIFLISPLVVKYVFSKKKSFIFSLQPISYSSVLSASVLIIIVKPIVSWLSEVNGNFDFTVLGEFGSSLVEKANLLTDKMSIVTVSNSIEELMLNILIIALIPAIAEEFFFRGFIQQYLTKYIRNYHISIWITSLIFGIIHFNIINLLPLVFLGAILGYTYHFTQNIWISILAHFINNSSLLYFVYKYSLDIKDAGNGNISVQSLVFSLVMTIALLFFMYTARNHRKTLEYQKHNT